MTVRSAPFYWHECDACGVKSTEGSEFAAWQDEAQAGDDAENADWLVQVELPIVGKVDLCEDHRPLIGPDDEWTDL